LYLQCRPGGTGIAVVNAIAVTCDLAIVGVLFVAFVTKH
jgi:hypothetical protein